MKLVAGLGNPGREYAGTRHNVGFEVVDRIAGAHGLSWALESISGPEAMVAKWRRTPAGTGSPIENVPVLVAKPLTFMNRSGDAVAALARYFKIELPDLLIICDDVYLPVGRLRARTSGSEGGHNGLRSIAEQLGTNEYTRLRVGVGRGDDRRDLADHVLARFGPEEDLAIRDAVARAADAVETWIADGAAKMMNLYNREGT